MIMTDDLEKYPPNYREWKRGDKKCWINDWGWYEVPCDPYTGDNSMSYMFSRDRHIRMRQTDAAIFGNPWKAFWLFFGSGGDDGGEG